MTGYLTFTPLERVGRLGNQAIQISASIGLARRYGIEPLFPAGWSYRPFFKIPDSMFDDSPHVDGTTRGTESYSLSDLDHIAPEYRIYMQDLSLWADAAEEVRSYFDLTSRGLTELGGWPENIHDLTSKWLCVHVRRGDNVSQQLHYPLPSVDYYVDGVKAHPDHDVIIFGDDHEWNTRVLAKALEPRRVVCIEGFPRKKEHEEGYWGEPVRDWHDLVRMAVCDAYVLSNSTLGMFAAWLSGSNDVTTPTPWYGPALPGIDIDLLLPAGWQRQPNQGRVPC